MSGGHWSEDLGDLVYQATPIGMINALTTDEIARRAYVNKETARRWLVRLHQNGEVVRDKFGRTHLYYRT